MKTYEQFINERKNEISISDIGRTSGLFKYAATGNPKEDSEKLKYLVTTYYEKTNKLNPNFGKTMEVEWDDKNKLYKVWVEPYSENELVEGKTGISESHPKGKYPADKKNNTPEELEFADLTNLLNQYDYIVLAKSLKTNDPYSWVEHEIGHILGYRSGIRGYTKKGKNKSIYNDEDMNQYPNTMDEYTPFLNQMKNLKSKGFSDEEIINRIMVDYENSVAHKNDKDGLQKMRNFFTKFLKEKV